MRCGELSVLVIGRSGQLARELQRARWPQRFNPGFADRGAIDLSNPVEAGEKILDAAPDIVINAAAYTAVDRAESEYDLAHRINALAPASIAAACSRLKIPLLTFSTDYVFDGTKDGAYVEDDLVAPQSAYGLSKAEGERLVRSLHDQHVILRTSWMYSAFGNNFVRTMLRLGAERPVLRVVADQRGKPTAAGDLARAVICICSNLAEGRALYGTYHIANNEVTTWHGFAQAIFESASARGAQTPERVEAIATSDYPTPAVRPANSELACEKFEAAFVTKLRSWREPLAQVIGELRSSVPHPSGQIA